MTTESAPSGTNPAVLEDLSGVAVIIPALNEAASLPFVLSALPNVGTVIVVDNGSTDDTAAIADWEGALVVSEPRRGYGSACLCGLAKLRELTPAPRIVVFLDADYSDHPQLLPQLVAPILAGRADFVLGSRLLGMREQGAMPAQSILGNRFACWLMRHLSLGDYTDLGPFRAISYAALKQLEMVDRNFGWTVEMQIKATRQKLRTLEVPVPYRCRIGQSKISGTVVGTIRAGYKILYLIAKYGWPRRSSSKSE